MLALFLLALGAASIGQTLCARADEPVQPEPRDLRGSVGIVDMPSARFAPDGQLSFGASFSENTQHYILGFQALPWLETTFRYTGLQNFSGSAPTYYDRSVSLKARLWGEDTVLPAVAIGVDDFIGTGIYGAEYLVASKRFGDFDASLGIGWGRLGSSGLFKNPLASLFSSFNNRPSFNNNAGGSNFDNLFHGPTSGLFGGIVWHTPIERLSLMAEYSSDTYALERSTSGFPGLAQEANFTPSNQFNFGATYQIIDGIALSLDWLYGRSIGGSVTFALDPVHPQFSDHDTPPVPPLHVRSAEEQQEGLDALLHGQDSLQTGGRRISGKVSSNFVDALWLQGGFKNVEIKGSAVFATIMDIPSPSRCERVAQQAASLGASITHIVLTDGGRHPPARCLVPQPPKMLQTAALLDPSENSQRLSGVLTIDASTSKRLNQSQAIALIRADAAKQKIGIDALTLGQGEATVYYVNDHYFSETDALGRMIRVLMADAPPDIERFRLISVIASVPQRAFDVLRAPMERLGNTPETQALENAATLAPAPLDNPVLETQSRGTYPRFSWGIVPKIRQSLFDPDQPVGGEIAVGVNGTLELLRGLSIAAEGETSLADNFANRPNTSTLAHVRSDFQKYFAQGRTGIGDLEADYRFRLAPSVFAIAKVGYLENMFAGGGGEVLWRPQEQRWALGVDMYEVWQRNFDQLLRVQPYHVATGHISLYYTSPWYGLNFVLRAGQYLAGDRGATLEVTRRFSTGVEIGAFVTKTDVAASSFNGFDEGIMIRIPLEWALPLETQNLFAMDLRPLERDNGQRLKDDASLYDETNRSSEAVMEGHWGDLTSP